MLKTNSSKIDYDSQLDCVIMEWQGIVALNTLKVGAGQALQLLKDKQAQNFLNNEQETNFSLRKSTDLDSRSAILWILGIEKPL